jgi:hypothetical protein
VRPGGVPRARSATVQTVAPRGAPIPPLELCTGYGVTRYAQAVWVRSHPAPIGASRRP